MPDDSGGASQPSLRTPPIAYSALVFALLGFACGLPAIIGLTLGIVARKQAIAAQAGVGIAKAAILVSTAWLVLYVALVVIAVVAQRDSG